MSSGNNRREQTAGLERALASALPHGTNWKLSRRDSIACAQTALPSRIGKSLPERCFSICRGRIMLPYVRRTEEYSGRFGVKKSPAKRRLN
jgi:hypothetical protein